MQRDWQTPLIAGAAEMGLELKPNQAGQLEDYLRELFRWNEFFNLVSARTTPDAAVMHVLDCLSVVPYICHYTGSLLDLGSGGGLPGIPLKIVLPELTVRLVEATRKKSSFLNQVIRKLHLEEISVLQERAERLAADPARHAVCEIVISRATFHLKNFIRTGAPFLTPGGHLVAMKGPHPEEEIHAAATTCAGLNLTHLATHPIQLPRSGGTRTIVLYASRRKENPPLAVPENTRFSE